MLWNYTAQADGRGGPDIHGPAWPQSIDQVPRPGRVLGSPSLRDVDGDGIVDLIAAFVLLDDVPARVHPPEAKAQPTVVEWDGSKHSGRRLLVAVSGRSGKGLWAHLIDPQSTTLPFDPLDRGAMLADARNGSTVAFVDDARWIGLDIANGQPRGQPIDLGFVPVRPVQHADLDGDGEPEILRLGRGPLPNSRRWWRYHPEQAARCGLRQCVRVEVWVGHDRSAT